MTRSRLVPCLALAALVLVGCGGSHAAGLTDGPDLVGIGDSYVSGVAQPHELWVSQVARAGGLHLVNRGRASTSSRDALRVAKRVHPGGDDVVVIDTGLNDLRRSGSDPARLEAFRANLTATIRAVRGARCVIVVPPLPLAVYALYPPFDKGSNAAVVAYEKAAAEVAGAEGAHAADAAATWNPPLMISVDQAHPNPLGEATIAASVGRALQACPGAPGTG